MATFNPSVRWLVISLLLLLLVPLVLALGMMGIGAMSGGGMMSHMGGMMGGGSMMGGAGMFLSIVWIGLIVAVLILLIVNLTRGSDARTNRDKAA
jgi:uncharacterized membrane protein